MVERRLNIAVLGTRGFPNAQGGVERHCEELYPRLVSLGCTVTVYARKGYVPDSPYEFKGVHVIPLWTVKRKSLEAIIHTLYGLVHVAMRKSAFDIVHIHGIGPSLVVPLCRLFGLKVVVTNHGPDYERAKWGKTAKLVLRAGEFLGTEFASAVIAVSMHIKSILEQKYKRSAAYIPNGVTLHKKVPIGSIREKYALKPGRYLLSVGRLVPEKGFHDLLEAYAGVKSDWKLVIAGGADHEDRYSIKLHEQASRDPRVVMTGFITGDLLAEIYSNASFLVLPSYHEGLPITILEAMSYGLPVLASSIPANRELFDSEDMLFPAGNVGALQDKLTASINSSNSENSASKNLDRVKIEFHWDDIAQRTLDLYLKIV